MKYNWTDLKLEDRLIEIMEKLAYETNPEKIDLMTEDVDTLESYLLDDYFNPDELKLLDAYKSSKNILNGIPFLWDDYFDYHKIVKKPIDCLIKLKRNSLSKDDLMQIVHDFYKSLDSYFFGNFMKSFYRRKDHVRFIPLDEKEQIQGQTISILSQKESYIIVGRSYNIDDVRTLAHEYMHSVSSLINPRHNAVEKSIYSEVDTLFIELLISDYLKEKFNNDDAIIAKIINDNRFCSDSEDITDKLNLIKNEDENHPYMNNKELKDAANVVCHLFPEEVEGIYYSGYILPEVYLTSYMFSLEFYHKYKEDKEKALYLLKKFILLDSKSEEDYYDNILKMGIIPNEHLRETHNSFIEEFNEINKKIENKKYSKRTRYKRF